MRANEFFKKVGIEAVKSYIVAYEDHLTDELKRLVESYELVERMGGTLNDIKEHVRIVERNLSRGVYFECTIERNTNRINRIKQAIADVESCQ